MKITRRHFLGAAAAIGSQWIGDLSLGQTLPTIQPLPAHPPKIGRSSAAGVAGSDVASISSSSTKSFRILQITDMHFLEKSGQVNEPTKNDRLTYEDCKKYIDTHKPDLIVLSGDWWFENPHDRASAALDWAIKEQGSLGVPWTFCWGNHDLAADYQAVHDRIEAAPNSLYRGGKTHGDHRLEVRAKGAMANNVPVLDLLLMNTSDVGLGAWQLDWYERTRKAMARKTPSIVFFHIPLVQYEMLYDAETTAGAKFEKVSSVNEDGRSLPRLEADGTMRACFCGHDHTNDYAVSDRGVDLVFGRATGRDGYGGEKLRKGAKVIDIDLPTGKYQETTVFTDGTSWKRTTQPAGVDSHA